MKKKILSISWMIGILVFTLNLQVQAMNPCEFYSSNPCDQAVNPCDFFGSDPCRSSVNDLFGSNRRTSIYDDPNQRLLEERLSSCPGYQSERQIRERLDSCLGTQSERQIRERLDSCLGTQSDSQIRERLDRANQNNNYGVQNNQNNKQRFQPDLNNNNQQYYQGNDDRGQNNGDQNSRKRKFDAPNGPGKSEEDERDGKRRRISDPKRVKDRIAKANKIKVRFQQQGENNPEIKNAVQVVELLNNFAEYFLDSDDIAMADAMVSFSANILIKSNGFFLRLKQSETQAAKEFFTKEHFQQQVVEVLHVCVSLMNNFAEEQARQKTFDTKNLNEHGRKQRESGLLIMQAINNGFEQLKKTSWEDLSISGANIGSTFILNCVTFNLVGKSIDLLACGSKTGLAKYNEMVSVKLSELVRALQQENPLTKPFSVEMAGVEKIFVDHGAEVMQKTVETIKKNPSLVTQEGKSVSQVLREVAGGEIKKSCFCLIL